MRSNLLTALTLFTWLASVAAGSALKGVRGSRRLQTSASSKSADKKVKKCKKEKVKEPKASELALKADPKAQSESTSDDKAAKDLKTTDPKLADDKKSKDSKTKDSKSKDSKSKDSKKGEPETECLEWEYIDEEATDREMDGSGGDIVTEPTFGSTGSSSEFQSVNVDCDAIASGSGPTDSQSVSFSVNIDVLKDASSGMQAIYSAIEKELQNKVAPRIAGCSQETSKIVNVKFGEMEFDHSGCDSSLAQQAPALDGVCMASDIPVDVYYVGDFPASAKAKVEVAIEEHEWNIEGLLATSEVVVTENSGSETNGGPGAGGFAGIAVAALAAAGIGFFVYKKTQSDVPVAKAELETDEESSDDEKKIPEIKVEAVKGK